MAKTTTTKKVIRKRREKKNVEKGAVHIRSTYNNTIVTITDTNGNACPGRLPAKWASEAPKSPLLSQHKPPVRLPESWRQIRA